MTRGVEMQDQQPQQTQKPALKFCLVQRPERIGWPIHGQFALYTRDGIRLSMPIFSLAAGQAMLQTWVKEDEIDADAAAESERQVQESGLPQNLTRWDRIARSFDEKTARILIDRFCGAFPSKPGSEPARLKLCVDGEYCGSDNCGKYTPHGLLVLKGMYTAYGDPLFTPEAAKASFEAGLELGVFTPDDERTIIQTANAQLTDDETARRADKLVALARYMRWMGPLGEELDYIFGLQLPEKSARFEPCSGDHAHLYIRDDQAFSTGCFTAYEARITLDSARDAGLLAQSDYDRLAAEIEALGLPPGSPEESRAAQDQRRVPEILNVLVRLLTGR